METRTINPIELRLHISLGEWIVEIHIENAFWDVRNFGNSEAAARQFFADPLAAIRPKEKPVEIDRSYLALNTFISKGKRIGKKPPC